MYNRFARQSQAEIGHSVFAELASDADFEEVFVDSIIMRVHQHAAGAPKKNGDPSIGRSRGGLTIKIPARVDELGMLARFSLTGGQVSDTSEALPLLGELKPASLAADKAYDTNAYFTTLGIGGHSGRHPQSRGSP